MMKDIDYVIDNRPLLIVIPLMLYFSAWIPQAINAYFYYKKLTPEYIRVHNEKIKNKINHVNVINARA